MRPSAIDLSAPFPTLVDDETVLVPDISIPNSELFLQQLQRYNIDPLHDDSNYGVSLYQQSLNLLAFSYSCVQKIAHAVVGRCNNLLSHL